MTKDLPDLAILQELLDYNPETGDFTWKPRGIHLFPDQRSCSTWNARYANSPALTQDVKGYRQGTIFYKRYYAHRIAYFMHHRVQPDLIDHIDGNRANNRISNLRDVNLATNFRNLGVRGERNGAALGVSQAADGKWTASISKDGQAIYLGRFATFAEAVACRFGAERALGFHENHGRRRARQSQQPLSNPVS